MKTTLKRRNTQSQGFSLVETLVVVSIMVILATTSAMMIPGIMSAQVVAQASSDISQTLDDARSYAIANHTYVFVGFEEVSAANSPNSVGQAQATASTGGRIAVAIVASRDGTNSYISAAPYFNSANLTPISKVKFFSGVHLADFSALSATGGAMSSRVAVASTNSLGANSTGGTTGLFTWPLNASSAATQYSFFPGQVIVFDQEGLAGVVGSNTYAASGYNVPSSTWIEIGLQITHGSTIPALPTSLMQGQLASIQLDGVTGGNRILRP